MDVNNDNRISQQEFQMYIKKRNPEQDDQEQILKEFRALDINHDGYFYFLDFLRAVCHKNGVYLQKNLTLFEKLQIFKVVEYRHISDLEKAELMAGLQEV